MDINDFLYTYVVNKDLWLWLFNRFKQDKNKLVPILVVGASLLSVMVFIYVVLVMTKYEAGFSSTIALFVAGIYGRVVVMAAGGYEGELAIDFCAEKGYYNQVSGFKRWFRFCTFLIFTLIGWSLLLSVNRYMKNAMM